MSIDRKGLFAVLMVALALFLLRVPALFHPVLDVDEAIYGLFARIWFDGGVPYLNCVETKPLGIYFIYGSIFSLFGRFNMIAVHAVTIFVVGITAYVLYLIARDIYSSKKAGFWAALLYSVFTACYIPKVIATTIEPIMLLPVALQFYLWIRFERENKSWLAFASGAAFATACLFKYQGGMNLFILMAYLGIAKPLILREYSYFSNWRGFFRFLLGGIVPPVIMLIYLWHAGALKDFVYWNVKGNFEYIYGGAESINLFHQILTRVLPYIGSTLLIWLLCGARIKEMFKERSRLSAPETLILIWFVFSIVPVSMGSRFYGHYFLLLLPAMSILGGRVAERIFETPGAVWRKRLVVILMLAPMIVFTVTRIYITDVHKAFKEDNLADYRPLAEYVAKNTKPSDRIIAWGYAPLVYWYSERLPGTRFFWSDTQTGRVPGLKRQDPKAAEKFIIPETWDMFFDDIERFKPVYIIDTTPANLHDYLDFPMTLYPRLMDYVNKHYREETRIDGSIFYRRIEQ